MHPEYLEYAHHYGLPIEPAPGYSHGQPSSESVQPSDQDNRLEDNHFGHGLETKSDRTHSYKAKRPNPAGVP
jgi:hypothetical protein